MYEQSAEILNNREFAVLIGIVDTLLPGGAGFPPASEVATVGYMMGKLLPGEMGTWLRPGLAAVDSLAGNDFLSMSEVERVATLQAVEREYQAFFERLLALVYYSYYAQPSVVAVIQHMGFDYNHAPQPLGYVMAPFDRDNPEMLPAQPRGYYKTTEDIENEVRL